MITLNKIKLENEELSLPLLRHKIDSLNQSIHNSRYGQVNALLNPENATILLNHLEINIEYPLYMAVQSGSMKIVQLLLDKGAKPNVISRSNQETPIHCAARIGLIDIVSMLLKAGAKTDSLNSHLATPTMVAYVHGRINIAQLLEKHSNDFNQYWLLLKMLNHRFGLGETVKLDDKPLKLEGLYFQLTSRFLRDSFEKFMDIQLSDHATCTNEKKHVFQSILDSLNFGVLYCENINKKHFTKQMINRIGANRAVPLYTGWEGHTVVAVITSSKLIKCNRGEEATKETTGCTIFAMPDKTNLPSVINNLRYKFNTAPNKGFFQEKMDKTLNLSVHPHINHLSLSFHKNGTCSWASLKSALRALAMIAYEEQQHSPQDAAQKSYELYKQWSLWDRNEAIKEFVEFTRQGEYKGKAEILRAIYSKSQIPNTRTSLLTPEVNTLLREYA